jgi:predicted house-cleaning noncanonical NTP pyrophosphatase (MazG superfamily)
VFQFEWLCDGKQVYVVQVDSEDKKKGGINPKSLVKTPKTLFDEHNLKVFRKATDLDFEKYAKLANTNIYRNIGYRIVDFYILDDHKLIADIAAGQNIPRELLEDLKSLTSRALVIRTDGSEIPENYQTMLPRSDELRSLDNALDWLRDSFITKINEVGIADSKLCLIAHHFLPATSSAWCLASPDSRKVRIESLWGIPEGLYWYAHDVFDVDTRVKEPSSSFLPKKNLIIKARTRYKEKFIAPNNEGNWVLHETDELSDWSSSISDFNINKKESSWVTEIAWNSRRIAKEAGKPVVIMWFIDIPTELCNHSVIPWYHTSWEQKGAEYKKATPKHKDPNSSEYRIENEDDWQELHRGGSKLASISRVIVDPKEPELVRNQKFAEDLANFVIKHNLVVELSGGILSHAFYMLTKRGANVECKDLYATEDEELEFNKLVRDLIPENIIAGGEHVEVLALRNDALLASLKRKLVEESLEVFDAETTTEIREEIADLREVVDRLAEVLNISEEQIKETRAEKNEKRGNFSKGIMLTKTKLSPTMSKGEKERVFFEDIMDSELRIIEKIGELPYSPAKLNQDKRLKDDKAIKQLTFTIPLYSQNIDNLKGNLPFSNDSGVTLEVEVTVDVERNGSELKIKLNLTNAPKQLDLDIDQF